MPSPAAPRVFISYSSKDAEIVKRARQALANAGVAVWLDHEQLKPGTPDWRAAVLKGIEQAATVIYCASPDAAASKFVTHELEIAEGEHKTILPFWIRGEKWYFCAPLGFGATQHIDARGAAYATGLARLLNALGATGASSAAPTPAAPPIAAPQPRYPLPNVPPRLASLGFRGVNPHGTPAIIPPLVSVAAGPPEGFLMGSDKARDLRARDGETPQSWVGLAGFSIGKYPVTVAEYALAVNVKAVREPYVREFRLVSIRMPELKWQTQRQRLDHPVIGASWQDAMAYIAWLCEATDESGWRLPTEAEWEKAARWDPRANTSRLYPWGDSFDQNRCNTRESGIGHTTPVGSYPASDARRSGASPWGAEELAGNVWEWTSSLYKPYPYIVTDGREAPDSTDNIVLRGGSWVYGAGYARAACRSHLQPDIVYNIIGFRLVRASPGSFH